MGERRDSPTATRAADGLGDVPTAPFPPVADDGPVLPGVNAEVPPAQHVRVFGSRAYFRLWLAQVVSSLGDWIGFVAIVALAQAIGGSSPEAAIALVMSARLVPGFFFSQFAGVLDRPVGPQEGHGVLRHRSRPRARDVAVHRHGVRDWWWRRCCSRSGRCCGRRPKRHRSRTSCRKISSPPRTRCRSWRHTARSPSRASCSRSSRWVRAASPTCPAWASSTSTARRSQSASTSARSSCRP